MATKRFTALVESADDDEELLGMPKGSQGHELADVEDVSDEEERNKYWKNHKVVQWLAVFLSIFVAGVFCAFVLRFAVGLGGSQAGPYTILLSLDGFRWDYPQIYSTKLPHLTAFAEAGVMAEYMTPVEPVQTLPNHYTLVTGLHPASHGILGNTFYDPALNKTFGVQNPDAYDEKWFWGEPFWVTVQKHGWKAASLYWFGSEAEIGGVRPTYYEKFSSRPTPTERVEQVIKWLSFESFRRPSFISLYFDLIDHQGHVTGPLSSSVGDAVAQFDAALGKLVDGLKLMGMDNTTNIIILSDHGMTKISPSTLIFIDDYIDMNTITLVEQGARCQIIPKPGYEDLVTANLTKAHPNMTLYSRLSSSRETLPVEFSYIYSPRTTPIILIADLGWMMTTHAYYTAHRDMYIGGAHGFPSKEKDMRAFFAARGPHFKSGVVGGPVRSLDVYELLCDIYKIQGAPNNGTLTTWKPFLA